MEKFYNDIVSFIVNLNVYLRMAIIAILVIFALLLLRNMVRTLTKQDKAIKIGFLPFILFVIIMALTVFIAYISVNS